LAGQREFIDIIALARNDGDHRRMDVCPCGEASVHDNRGARRDIAAEFGKACQMIGRYRRAHSVKLVDPHGVGQIAAEFLENAAHPAQQIIGFAPQWRATAQAIARRAFHFWRKSLLEVEGFVAVEEYPRPRFHCICVVDGAADEACRFCRDGGGRRSGTGTALGEAQRGARSAGDRRSTGVTRRQRHRSSKRRGIGKQTAPSG
jgi:hypothetical protein